MMKKMVWSALLMAVPGLALAGMVNTEDFETIEVGERPVGFWKVIAYDGLARIAKVVQDENNLLGLGTDNKVLLIKDTATDGGVGIESSRRLGPVATFSMDLVMVPLDKNVISIQAGVKYFRNGRGEVAQHHWISDGRLSGKSAYGDAEPMRLDYVFNNGQDPIEYEGVTLPSGSSHIWLNGRQIDYFNTTEPGSEIPANEIGKLRIWSGHASMAQVLVDNIQVHDGAVVTGQP